MFMPLAPTVNTRYIHGYSRVTAWRMGSCRSRAMETVSGSFAIVRSTAKLALTQPSIWSAMPLAVWASSSSESAWMRSLVSRNVRNQKMPNGRMLTSSITMSVLPKSPNRGFSAA